MVSNVVSLFRGDGFNSCNLQYFYKSSCLCLVSAHSEKILKLKNNNNHSYDAFKMLLKPSLRTKKIELPGRIQFSRLTEVLNLQTWRKSQL